MKPAPPVTSAFTTRAPRTDGTSAPPYAWAVRRLKVAQVITRMIVGGAQETALLTCHLLDPERFETVLVTGPQAGSEGELLSEAERLGVRVRIVPDLVREVAPVHDLRAFRELRRVLDDEGPDVVHTHSSNAGVLGRLAAPRRRYNAMAVVHTVHGWSFHDHMG